MSFKFNVIYNPHLKKKISIYHKINYPPKKKSELNIFEEKKKMFTLIRNPTDTIISSYYHFNHIISMTLEDYANQFTNIQTKFPLGYDIFLSVHVEESHLQKIIKLINQEKLIIGIHQTKK